MSRALSPDFTLPPLCVAPSGRGQSLESLYAINEELCLLVLEPIDNTLLGGLVTDAVLRDWYDAATAQGVSLLVVRTSSTIELYATQQDYASACRRPLLSIAQWSQQCGALRCLRVSFRRGASAAERLLSRVAKIGIGRRSVAEWEGIESSFALASRAGALGDTTVSLWEAARKVHRRVVGETMEGTVTPSEGLCEIADIGAIRVVEEELLVWKAEQAARGRSLSRRNQAWPKRDRLCLRSCEKERTSSSLRLRPSRAMGL